RAADTGEDDQPIAGEFEVDVAEVMFAGAADDDAVLHNSLPVLLTFEANGELLVYECLGKKPSESSGSLSQRRSGCEQDWTTRDDQSVRKSRGVGSDKSVTSRSGADASSSSRVCQPVATAMAFAPMARAQRTSSGVSPTTQMRSGVTVPLKRARTSSSASRAT